MENEREHARLNEVNMQDWSYHLDSRAGNACLALSEEHVSLLLPSRVKSSIVYR